MDVVLANYVGATVTDASNVLKWNRLEIEVIGDGDVVTAQVPEAGARVSGGSGFVVLYTNGEMPQSTVEVPDLSGLSIYTANNVAASAGLNVSMSGSTNGSTATVVSQSLEPGVRVPRGTVIRIEMRYMDGND